MEFAPCHDWVLIRPDDNPNTTTKAGLVVLDGGSSVFMKGVVKAVGSDVVNQLGVRVPISCKVGDRVLYVGAAAEYMLDGLKYVLIRDSAIVGVLSD